MKTLKAFFLIALFSISFFTANAAIEPTKTMEDLKQQISEYIQESNAFEDAEEMGLVKVRFMITPDSKLLVINTSSDIYDDTFKSILNYKSLEVSSEMIGEYFTLPVRITKE